MANYSDLKNYLSDDIKCFAFDSIPSTNDYLAQLAFCTKTQVCVTSEQTHGKGQYDRKWLSQKDTSIMLSIRYVFPSNILLSGLSLVVGLALVDVLEKYGISDLKLKWPNDVYFEGRKLAGILIENSLQGDYQSVIIGLGLNVNFNEDFQCETSWIDLKKIISTPVDKLNLSKDLINKILEYFDIFESSGFGEFYAKWVKVDYLLGKQVKHTSKAQLFSGTCLGVNHQGILLVKTQYGVKPIYSSEFLHLC
ncbi:bifunctional biotin biosynthesis protein BirA [Abyssogena phaseoliformis symbiont OG214]|uniref:biotin--[acetyl-CoA-carboxylase] ligase n=1 Tax=Abyssogena phaseoliformis symbiont TaxID=596095 RepID=UPI001916B9FB|nr:biotin--[acetyl-CoA-carboxylase] ligase [Abyssogena phaseoliformis symbiont]MBW5289843.1 Biotin--protein ligase [Candidatus Ruthia sp. Apha_13_S6]BBB23109.1 bifunctional biotin biosynthesis protein BirA [Abyssogena phaseoliformis symbiont OG214]